MLQGTSFVRLFVFVCFLFVCLLFVFVCLLIVCLLLFISLFVVCLLYVCLLFVFLCSLFVCCLFFVCFCLLFVFVCLLFVSLFVVYLLFICLFVVCCVFVCLFVVCLFIYLLFICLFKFLECFFFIGFPFCVCTIGEYVWSGGGCPLVPRDPARKVKFSVCLLMHYDMEACGIKEGKAPLILIFGNNLWVAASFAPGPLGTLVPIVKLAGWTHSRCGRCKYKNILFKLQIMEHQFPGRPAHVLGIMLTDYTDN